MLNEYQIVKLETVHPHSEKLAGLLCDTVNQGASIGFIPPLKFQSAKEYWESLNDPSILIWGAETETELIGTIQLQFCTKENGRHRAEVAKLMVHPDHRKKGIARRLLETAERAAAENHISLLVLDTREGDPSNKLYLSHGYQRAGSIPFFAQSAEGDLETTVLYYKVL
ncbi:GNAT family N-acetyltransferase [Bacillus lacus]|uniref:GNAT family N-acetyltransferase n=1 Tax=Metabacillus lacus TaxID=1983721 RepID=A0A7X2J379_9BACI|nr:GNAT family N-acetyltransferase [Metabacillus lacus]MRX73798.1 GNAT family N-acetyltransferase [Metabacillus lacus]